MSSATQTLQTLSAFTLPTEVPVVRFEEVRSTTARFSVADVCDRGGFGSAGFDYELRTESGAVVAEATFPCCELSLSNLLRTTTYLMRVRVRNSAGPGNWTDAIRFGTPSGVPSMPTTALVFASTTQLQLSLSQPTALNMSALSIEIVAKRAATLEVVFETTLACDSQNSAFVCPATVLINGLDAVAASYEVSVRATSDGGMSEWSRTTYATDAGDPGTLGFLKTAFDGVESESVWIDVGRLYGSTLSENVTFSIADTIAFTDSWVCETVSFGASCYASANGLNTGSWIVACSRDDVVVCWCTREPLDRT